MVKIEWTQSAKDDLLEIKNNFYSYNEKTTLSYLKNLVNYIDILSISNYLGKFLFKIGNLEIRQLLYKKHRIIYTVLYNKILILSVVHTSMNIEKILKYIMENY